MKVLFKVSKQDFEKAKEKLLKDEEVSRASIKFKCKNFCYILVEGNSAQCEKAKELVKEFEHEMEEGEEEKIMKEFEEEEEKAIEGFGCIFG